MASGFKVPVGATLIDRKTGDVVDEGPNQGKRATIELYRGFYSQGYKTDFEQVETWWFAMSVEDAGRWTFRYSGKRAGIAREQFDDCAQAIEA